MATADRWKKQTSQSPLFPDMLWSRPENRLLAGKLLIVGGNAQGFAAPAAAYGHASKAGVGTARVLLPDALQKSLGPVLEAGEFAPSTPSGSLGRPALAELLAMANWADGVLLAGDLGRNSETAILLESFLQKYDGQITITRDSIEYATASPHLINQRPNTLIVLSFSQLQKMVTALKFPRAVTLEMDLLRTVDLLQALSLQHPFIIITKHLNTLLVASNGTVSTTPCPTDDRVWRLRVASGAAVWWLQNPSRPFEAITTSLVA